MELNKTIVLLDADALERGDSVVRATKYSVVDAAVQDVRHALTGYKSEDFQVTMYAPTAPEPPVEAVQPVDEEPQPESPVEG
jgi:hypothetical protein